jgi:hypothetical protein
MFTKPKPRFVLTRELATGETGYYWQIPYYYRDLGCTIPNEPLGSDYTVACGADGKGGRAAALNGLFDEWNTKRKGGQPETSMLARFGTVAWLFRQYFASDNCKERVSERTRPDYENLANMVCEVPTKDGRTVGDLSIRSITPRAADKIYAKIIAGPKGERLRQGEKALSLSRHAWRVVHRLYPTLFDPKVPYPWDGTTKKRRSMKKKAAVDRDLVYQFARGAIALGYPEPAAAAVICFEWLQRPENVLAGYLKWPDYRPEDFAHALRIEHHKTGELVWHPLEEETEEGLVKFYEEAEEILSHLPKRGVPMILQKRPDGTTLPFTIVRMGKRVRKLREKLKLPSTFTLDACRHGGMTELEEAELTDGQGRALSGHRTQRAYQGYAKRSLKRALPGTRKRHAHRVATAAAEQAQADRATGKIVQKAAPMDKAGTKFRNGDTDKFRNELAGKG